MAETVAGLLLSPQQRRVWALLGAGVCRSRCAVRLTGDLAMEPFEQALADVVERHEILRTTFRRAPGIKLPVQVISPADREITLTSEPVGSDRDGQRIVDELWDEADGYAVDLAQGPLPRLRLAAVGPREHVLQIDLPALCADGPALHNLVRELGRAYADRRQGTDTGEEPLQYGDLSQWLNDLLAAEETEPGRAHWARLDLSPERLPGLDGAVRGEREARREPAAFSAPRRVRIEIPAEAAARAGAWARARSLPLSAFLLACWWVLLRRLSGGAELTVGVACAGRKYPELAGAIGLLDRYLPIACRLDEGDRFDEAATRIEESREEACRWQEAYDPPSAASAIRLPFGFACEETAAPFVAAGLSWSIVRQEVCIEAFDVELLCTLEGDVPTAEIRYDAAILEPAAAARLAARYQTVLASAAADPDAEILDLDVLSPAERELLAAFNDTAGDFPAGCTVHELFAEQAARDPDRVALVADDRELTYGELGAWSDRLAARLRALGVAPEVRVGLCLERSPAMVAGLLATLKAGGAYVPLDPSYPRERLAFMIADAAPAVLLTRSHLVAGLPAGAARVIALEGEGLAGGEEAGSPRPTLPASGAGPDHLAYVLYTSGSTGKPKGVMVPHRGVVNYLAWCLRTYGVTAGAGTPVHSSLSFDLTVTSLLAPLVAGSRVVLLPDEAGVESLALALRAGPGFSLVKITPAHLQALAHLIPEPEAAAGCRALVVGGENLAPEQVAFWHRNAPGTRVINEYGPTEAVVGCCTYEIPPGGLETRGGGVPLGVPTGRPITNARIYLLDTRWRPVPMGVPGEIHIGGAGLARGYLGRPELTAAVFLPDPWSEEPGGRLYATGDLARHLDDGNLEFAGRRDHQVKVRGFRIELGEVEAVLASHPAVTAAAVLARDDGLESPAAGAGERRLVAYVVGSAGGEPPDAEELRRHLAARLPDFMLPAAFVFLAALPLTAHGKVDRQALPAPREAAGAGAGFVAPRGPLEEIVAGIWSEVLGRQRIGIHDNFFRLGGHSMKAAQVVAKIRKRLGVEVRLQELFNAPTVAELVALAALAAVEDTDAAGERAALAGIAPVPERATYELSHAQKRLWFLDQQLSESSTTYNVLGAYVFAEALEPALVARAFDVLTRRHESLRTNFVAAEIEPGEMGGPMGPMESIGAIEPRQVVHPESSFRLDVLDLTGDPDREERVRGYARDEARLPFDLERDCLFRARLVLLVPRRSVLLFTLHHIISDGWSMQILFREFFVLYRAFAAGRPDPLPPLRIQYKDYAAWESKNGAERERRYWLDKLSGPLDLIRLPFDLPPKEIYDFAGALEVDLLSSEASQAVREIAFAQATTPSNVILSGFLIFLFKLTEQADLALATTTANRGHADLEGVVGFFVNALVVRAHIDEEAEFTDVLRQVTATVYEALEAQSYPFDQLVEELNPPRRGNRQPLFNVCYAFQGFDDLSVGNELADGMRGELAEVADLGERRPTSKFDLTLFVGERDGRYVLTFEYSTELFLPASMRNYLQILRRFLETIAVGQALVTA